MQKKLFIKIVLHYPAAFLYQIPNNLLPTGEFVPILFTMLLIY